MSYCRECGLGRLEGEARFPVASIDKYKDGYRVRYRTPDRRQRTKVFARLKDAKAYANRVEGAKLDGAYVDPAAGKVTFRQQVERWTAMQVWREQTVDSYDTVFARVLPIIGDRPLSSLRPSDMQALVRQLADNELGPASIEITYRAVAAVLKAAVIDRVIPVSPAVGVRLPKVERAPIEPLEVDQVQALADAMPARLRAAVLFAAGSGLRMGEVAGLTVDRVNFLRKTVKVDQQLITPQKGQPRLGPPKTPASNRTVPVAEVVIEMLSAHLAEFPAVDGFVFSTSHGCPWRRGAFARHVRTARGRAKLPPLKDGEDPRKLPEWVTFHDLRHHYASVLIAAGCSIKAVQSALGHKNASETLDTYSHLWPADEDRLRQAVELLHRPQGKLTQVSAPKL